MACRLALAPLAKTPELSLESVARGVSTTTLSLGRTLGRLVGK